jgi:uncharacterized protein YndB with AHSA1/START domain
MRIDSSCELGGPAELIWTALLDFDAYSQWNPVIVHAATNGRQLVSMHLDPGGDDRHLAFDFKIHAAEAPKLLKGRIIFGPPLLTGGQYTLSLDGNAQATRMSTTLHLVGLSRRVCNGIAQRLPYMYSALAKRLGVSIGES